MTGFDQAYELGIYDKWYYPWYVEFFLEGHSSGVTTLLGGDRPIKFEFQNESDKYYDPYRPSRVIITLAVTENFLFSDLFSRDQMSCYVKIYHNGDSDANLYWQGWVDPSQFKEPYDVPPFYLQITCIDGLSLLRNIRYVQEEDSSGNVTYYTGRKLESDIIYDILQKIGYSEFKEFINLYDISMNISLNDSPADQTLIDVTPFKELYCDEVLKRILSKHLAAIRQKEGVFCIYRPKDLVKASLAGRHFTNGSTKSTIIHYPTQYISRRETHLSAFRQVPGGDRMQQTVAKPRVHQDFGNKESWIDNFKLHAETYDSALQVWQGWDETGGNYAVPVGDYVGGEVEGVILITNSGFHSFFAEFGSFGMYAPFDLGVIEFEYGFYSTHATDYGPLLAPLLKFTSGVGGITQTLTAYDETTARWTYGGGPLSVLTTIEPGWSGWKTFRIQFTGFAWGNDFKVQALYNLYADYYTAFRNVKFFATSYEIRKKQVQRTLRQRLIFRTTNEGFHISLRDKYFTVKYKEVAENSVEAVYVPLTSVVNGEELDFDLTLGDVIQSSTPARSSDVNIVNIIEQFAGALATYSIESLITAAIRFASENADEWLTPVILTAEEDSSESVFLVFTAAVPGVDFDAGASISPIAGTLDGVASTLVANGLPTPQIQSLTFTGGSGSIEISTGGTTRIMSYYGSSMLDTIDHFIATYGATEAFDPITIERSGDDTIWFTGDGGNEFTILVSEAGISIGASDPVEIQAAGAGTARVDIIELSGTTGSATIWCNNVSVVMSIAVTTTPTTEWMEGDDSSGGAKPLQEFVGDELAEQYSRVKDFLDIPILETEQAPTSLDILGSFRDDFNKINGIPRAFVVNRGSFEPHTREWRLDLIEIVEAGTVPDEESAEESSSLPSNILLDDDGSPILNSDGSYIYTS